MATSSVLRQLNEKKIIRLMMRRRSASRAELAKTTGLSQPTVGRIVDRLMADSILNEHEIVAAPSNISTDGTPEITARPGRPSTLLELDRLKKQFVVIQVGVSHTRLAALPVACLPADEWPVQFATPKTSDAWVAALSAAWNGLRPASIRAVALSLPGVVDERAARVLFSPNLRWAERTDFLAIMRSLTDAPVLAVQEIRALALGHLFAEPESADFLLVDFGSGVGAAAVLCRHLYRAPVPLSGELGHTVVLGNRRRCRCGSIGCVETLVSRAGLLASAREQGIKCTWPRLAARLRDGPLPKWINTSLDAAAMTIAGALNVLGLRHAVFTGSISEIPSAAAYLCEAVPRGTMWAKFGDVDCRVAPRRRACGLVSAAINEVILGDGERAEGLNDNAITLDASSTER